MELFGSYSSEGEYLLGATELEESEEAYIQVILDEVPEYIERHEDRIFEAELEQNLIENEFTWDHELEPADN